MNVFVCFWVLVVGSLGYVWFSSWFMKGAYTSEYIGSDSLFVNVLMAVFLMLTYYAASKMMTGHWRRLKDRSFVLDIYEIILVPSAALTWPLGFDMFKIGKDSSFWTAAQVFAFGLLIVLLADPRHLVHRHLERVGLLERNKEWYLYAAFPPVSFADLTPFFVLLHMIYLAPIVL